MSLRSFHILFILLSILLSGWFGMINLDEYRASQEASALFWARAGFIVCGVLAVYGIWFVLKTRKILALAGLSAWFVAESASACAVCMGDPTSAIAGAANGAIFVMLGLLGLVLGSLGWFSLSLSRRAKASLPAYPELMANRENSDA